MFDPAFFDCSGIILNALDLLEQFGRDLSSTHLCDSFDLGHTQDGHNSWDDGKIDSNVPATSDKIKVIVVVKKKLSNQKIGACVHFALEKNQIGLAAWTLRVFLGISSGSDT